MQCVTVVVVAKADVSCEHLSLLPRVHHQDPTPVHHNTLITSPVALGHAPRMALPHHFHVGGFATISAWVWLWETPHSDSDNAPQSIFHTEYDSLATLHMAARLTLTFPLSLCLACVPQACW